MYTIEFKTKIKNGTIEIPEKFGEKLTDNVKVTLLAETAADIQSDAMEELLKYPLIIENFKPYKREEIYSLKG